MGFIVSGIKRALTSSIKRSVYMIYAQLAIAAPRNMVVHAILEKIRESS